LQRGGTCSGMLAGFAGVHGVDVPFRGHQHVRRRRPIIKVCALIAKAGTDTSQNEEDHGLPSISGAILHWRRRRHSQGGNCPSYCSHPCNVVHRHGNYWQCLLSKCHLELHQLQLAAASASANVSPHVTLLPPSLLMWPRLPHVCPGPAPSGSALIALPSPLSS
jgi:hypothetical protein